MSTSLNVLPFIDCFSDLATYLFSNFPTIVFLCYFASHKYFFILFSVFYVSSYSVSLQLQTPCLYCAKPQSSTSLPTSQGFSISPPSLLPSKSIFSPSGALPSAILSFPFGQQEGSDTSPKRKTQLLSKNKNIWKKAGTRTRLKAGAAPAASHSTVLSPVLKDVEGSGTQPEPNLHHYL